MNLFISQTKLLQNKNIHTKWLENMNLEQKPHKLHLWGKKTFSSFHQLKNSLIRPVLCIPWCNRYTSCHILIGGNSLIILCLSYIVYMHPRIYKLLPYLSLHCNVTRAIENTEIRCSLSSNSFPRFFYFLVRPLQIRDQMQLKLKPSHFLYNIINK